MTLTKTVTAILTLTTLTACDNVGKSDFARERADSTYRAAMSDYQAGRLPQAIEGFRKACVANPANASARFQLACLLQDSVKDYAGAFCAYREYLLQCPKSEKAKLAADRLAVCEREMAKALAEKYAPQAARDAMRQSQESQAARTKAETDLAKVTKELETANRELESLRQENARLKNFMRGDEEAELPAVSRDEIAAAKALAGEDAEAVAANPADDLAEAKRLAEEDGAEAAPLIVQASDAKAKRAAQEAAEKQKADKPDPYPHETRPETYVIQEGDTLYKIAIRFYGRASFWQRIRNANRATISTDGRLRVGQKIILPNVD